MCHWSPVMSPILANRGFVFPQVSEQFHVYWGELAKRKKVFLRNNVFILFLGEGGGKPFFCNRSFWYGTGIGIMMIPIPSCSLEIKP